MRYLWNISSHGWGHAARQRHLIGRLLNLKPDSQITVASDVPAWFWNGVDVRVAAGSPSPRVYENGWDVDLERTRREFKSFLGNIERHLRVQVDLQRRAKPDVVISDIDPLPLAAAGINSIPGLGIANFTWDWVMGSLFPDMSEQAEAAGRLYRSGTYLRLPPGPSHSPFRRTVDFPMLLSGRPCMGEQRKGGLPEGRICLIAMREPPPDFSPKLPKGWTMISSSVRPLADGILNFHPARLQRMGMNFSDLFHGAAVVVAKPGYGIVSQILAAGKPCVLITGRSFPEEDYLLEPFTGRRATALLPLRAIAELPKAVMEVHGTDRPDPVAAGGAEAIIKGGYLHPD